MVDINTILHGIERALDGQIDDDLSYITIEFDADNDNTGMAFPFVEIQATDADRMDQRPDKTPITDDSGGRIGTLYRYPWDAEIQITIKADADDPDPAHAASTLGSQIETELYRYDSEGRSTDFTDADGNPLVEINEVRVERKRPDDDIGSNPAIRQWITTLSIEYNKVVDSTEAFGPQVYVKEVITPQYGDFKSTGDGNEVEFDARDTFQTN